MLSLKKVLTKPVIFCPITIALLLAVYLNYIAKTVYNSNYSIITKDNNYNIVMAIVEKPVFIEKVYHSVKKQVDISKYSYDQFKDAINIIGNNKTNIIDVSVKGYDKNITKKTSEIIHQVLKSQLESSLTDSSFYIFNLKAKKEIINNFFLAADKKYQILKSNHTVKPAVESAIRSLAQIQASLEIAQDKEEQDRNSSQINIASLSTEIYSLDYKLPVTTANIMLDYYYWKYLSDNIQQKITLNEKSQNWKLSLIAGDFDAREKNISKIMVILTSYLIVLSLFIFGQATAIYYKRDE